MLKNKTLQHIFSIGLIFVFSFIAFGSFEEDAPDMTDWTDEQKKEYQLEKEQKEAKRDSINYETRMMSDAWYYAKKQMTKRLKAPSTAVFPETGVFDDQSELDFVKRIEKEKYKITSWVDSQNGFGAMIRTDFTCIIKFDNGWDPMGENEGKFYHTTFY